MRDGHRGEVVRRGRKGVIGRQMRLSGRIVEEEGRDAEEKMMRRWKNEEG